MNSSNKVTRSTGLEPGPGKAYVPSSVVILLPLYFLYKIKLFVSATTLTLCGYTVFCFFFFYIKEHAAPFTFTVMISTVCISLF